MKRILAFALVCAMLACNAYAVSVQEASSGVTSGNVVGIVTSTTVSIRISPSVNAEKYCTLRNGDEVAIVGETGDWFIINLEALEMGLQGHGYARRQYINPATYLYTLPKTVILWADTWGSGVANGEKTAGTTLRVLSENAEWLCVQTRDSSAGSSFIRKSDLGQSTWIPNGNVQANTTAGLYVVTASTLAVRSYPDDEKEAVGFLHNGDTVTVIQWGDYFTSIEYVMAGRITECWVHTQYLKKVYR